MTTSARAQTESNSALERAVEVPGVAGLHARPAAAFAEAAARFEADVTVSKGDREVDAKSVLLVLTLDVRQGDRIRLRAHGSDAARALDELAAIAGAP
jgi:phosphotransferase system HPr (HPr) family protein